jgi:hypothetical protein
VHGSRIKFLHLPGCHDLLGVFDLVSRGALVVELVQVGFCGQEPFLAARATSQHRDTDINHPEFMLTWKYSIRQNLGVGFAVTYWRIAGFPQAIGNPQTSHSGHVIAGRSHSTTVCTMFHEWFPHR